VSHDEAGGDEEGVDDVGGDGVGRDEVGHDPYLVHRRLLFTVAYEMLGSAVDAEDVLQDSWVKWSRVDQADVRDPRAYLVRIVTRSALDRLRVLARRREDYVGPWLPEPLRTAPDVAEDAELADSLSTAMLLVLETLSPTERAVFLLREVFDLGYDELAEAVGKSQAAVRQIARRARLHVAARRPRGAASQAECRRALEAFLTALETGDLQPLVDVLAPDVVALGDGGGIKQALPRPVSGIGKVAPLLRLGLRGMRDLGMTGQLVHVNGWPALLLRVDGQVDAVVSVRVDEGLVSGIYTVRNPEKLTRVLTTATVAR
jgi:RNA polymerase sigma-70 factor (ECF subfamily)